MAPDLLTSLTPEERAYAPELQVYIGLMHELRFDPFEPWYPCGCDGRFEDAHEDDCWLGWIRYPQWMTDDTQVIDGIDQQLALAASDADDERGPRTTHD